MSCDTSDAEGTWAGRVAAFKAGQAAAQPAPPTGLKVTVE